MRVSPTSSLVLELQQNALDDTVPASTLLRKALAVATKLDITDALEWIKSELNGYKDGASVPEYRVITGVLRARNPFHGWLPVVVGEGGPDAVPRPALTVYQSVAELERVAAGDKTLQTPWGALGGLPLSLFMAPSAFHSIVERVRSIVLEWALALEKKGILGEGLSFSSEERQAAQSINITQHFQ